MVMTGQGQSAKHTALAGTKWVSKGVGRIVTSDHLFGGGLENYGGPKTKTKFKRDLILGPVSFSKLLAGYILSHSRV